MLPHDEIYHYGIKGMKWGEKKGEFQAEKDANLLIKDLANSNLSMKSIEKKFTKKYSNLYDLKDKISPFLWARLRAAAKKRLRTEAARDPATWY